MLYSCVVVVAGIVFQYATSSGQFDVETLEFLLAYGISGYLLVTCWIIIKCFEKVEKRRVQERTRAYLRFFLVVYMVCLFLTLIAELLGRYFEYYFEY